MSKKYHPVQISTPSREWHEKAVAFANDHMDLRFSQAVIYFFNHAMAEAEKKQTDSSVTAQLEQLTKMVEELRRKAGD